MHRWLCTTAPLLIGSIAVGTIHAAPTSDACTGKHLLPHPHAGQQDAREAVNPRTLATATVVDVLRACTGCHDGTVARSDVDMRSEMITSDSQSGLVRVRFDARP